MTLTADDIQDYVTIAFCLEPLAEKEGCTTRSVDMPGKPLEDFIVAGINSGKYFRQMAQQVIENQQARIFDSYVPAIIGSNIFKSAKTINLGLLEIMFPAVYARLLCEDPDGVIDTMLNVMKKNDRREVDSLISARQEAWKMSAKVNRREFKDEGFRDAQSPFEFYLALQKTAPAESSEYAWAQQYIDELPILRFVFERLRVLAIVRPKDTLNEVAKTYGELKKGWEHVSVGIIADMCAAAYFLYLSYLPRSL